MFQRKTIKIRTNIEMNKRRKNDQIKKSKKPKVPKLSPTQRKIKEVLER